MSETRQAPLGVEELARRALELGTNMLRDVGTPLHPFLLDQEGNAKFLVDNEGGVDPMQMALLAIQKDGAGLQRCVLLVDTKLGFKDGKRWDAIVAMACDAAQDEGVVFAQRYVPKGWFRKFRIEGGIEEVAKCRNFIRIALEAQDEAAEEGARDVKAHLEATYKPSHRYRHVDAADFGHLDLPFYDTALVQLQAEGFSKLADLEDQTLTEAGGSLDRIMIRSMLSADRTITASAYDPKLKPAALANIGQHPPSVLDFETEFSDGAFVATTNVGGNAKAIQQPPMIMIEYLPPGSAASDLLRKHRERVEAYRTVAGVEPRPIPDLEAHISSQNRMNALKAAFRNELGGLSAAEMRALAGEHAQLAERMHAKLQELRADA